MLRHTRCNMVISVAATAWLMLSFTSCIVCGFDSYTVLFKCLWGHLESTVYETNPHTIQDLKNISQAVAATKITTLHPVYLNMVTARLLINCSNTLRKIHTNARENITRTRAKRKTGYFSWPILYILNTWYSLLLTAVRYIFYLNKSANAVFEYQHWTFSKCWQLHPCQQRYKQNVLLRLNANSGHANTTKCNFVRTWPVLSTLHSQCLPEVRGQSFSQRPQWIQGVSDAGLFSVRYELMFYAYFRLKLVSKGLILVHSF